MDSLISVSLAPRITTELLLARRHAAPAKVPLFLTSDRLPVVVKA